MKQTGRVAGIVTLVIFLVLVIEILSTSLLHAMLLRAIKSYHFSWDGLMNVMQDFKSRARFKDDAYDFLNHILMHCGYLHANRS